MYEKHKFIDYRQNEILMLKHAVHATTTVSGVNKPAVTIDGRRRIKTVLVC
jgi:hypothetical protein